MFFCYLEQEQDISGTMVTWFEVEVYVRTLLAGERSINPVNGTVAR